jgi:tyrosyl-tRNA synthetase
MASRFILKMSKSLSWIGLAQKKPSRTFAHPMDFLKEVIRGTETFIGEEDLKERLHAGKKLRVKLGVDPTRPDLTFGHMVVFNKLRQFQLAGHQAVLIIGDYTAMIGDPSGRSSTRPVLTQEEVEENARTYLDQAFKILEKENTEVRFNSEWFGKMSFGDTLALARRMTVARMLERDDFAKRYQSQEPISIVEFLYPLVQGYDSVVLEADIELGGSDQLFNMLVGRSLQKEEGKLGQAVATLPLLVGLDGVRKMSKSYDNYIAFTDSPKDMFGKIMSINDDVMWDYYKLLLLESDDRIGELKGIHPMEAKKLLASRLTSQFHGEDAGPREREQFEAVFAKKENPDEMTGIPWAAQDGEDAEKSLVDLLGATGQFESKGEIRRLVKQGAVKVDGTVFNDPLGKIPKPSGEVVVQCGKRKFFKVVA